MSGPVLDVADLGVRIGRRDIVRGAWFTVEREKRSASSASRVLGSR